jgi:hypothetical protein
LNQQTPGNAAVLRDGRYGLSVSQVDAGAEPQWTSPLLRGACLADPGSIAAEKWLQPRFHFPCAPALHREEELASARHGDCIEGSSGAPAIGMPGADPIGCSTAAHALRAPDLAQLTSNSDSKAQMTLEVRPGLDPFCQCLLRMLA